MATEAIQARRSYSVSEAKQLTCAHCGEEFKLDNPNADGEDHAFITGGLIEAIGCDNEELVYHGYLHQEDNCFFKATKGELFYRIDSDFRDELDRDLTDLVKKWFDRYGPRGCKLTKVSYQLDMTYAVPDARKQQHEKELIGSGPEKSDDED